MRSQHLCEKLGMRSAASEPAAAPASAASPVRDDYNFDNDPNQQF